MIYVPAIRTAHSIVRPMIVPILTTLFRFIIRCLLRWEPGRPHNFDAARTPLFSYHDLTLHHESGKLDLNTGYHEMARLRDLAEGR